jgi:tRNA pseudouridine65 synthase
MKQNPDPPVPIVHLTDSLVCVRKAPGLLSHGSELSRGEDNLMRRLRDQLGKWLWPLHRLDRGASGLILFALSADRARDLALAFREQRVHKSYHCLVRGWPQDEFSCDRALKDLEPPGPEREAVSHFQTIGRGDLPLASGPFERTRISLLKCVPESGRPHQLRRHLAGLGYPILGDRQHGDHILARTLKKQGLLDRLALICTELAFEDPETGKKLRLNCGLDPDLTPLLELAGLKSMTPGIETEPALAGEICFRRQTREPKRTAPRARLKPFDPLEAESACPLCRNPVTQAYHLESGRHYWSCGSCGLVHRDRAEWPDRSSEKARYEFHQNEDLAPYRSWLMPAVDLLKRHVHPGATGLDEGCGPVPVLMEMLAEEGFDCSAHDPLFHPAPLPEKESLDFITMTEVFEHLHSPCDTLGELMTLLKKSGKLLIMTGIVKDESFPGWHYQRDTTHVIFARESTMKWLERHYSLKLLESAGNCRIFAKE